MGPGEHTCRLSAPACCIAWIVSSTLPRSLISTELRASSGIWAGKGLLEQVLRYSQTTYNGKWSNMNSISFAIVLQGSWSKVLSQIFVWIVVLTLLIFRVHTHLTFKSGLCLFSDKRFTDLSLGQLLPESQDSPHWRVDPGNLVDLHKQLCSPSSFTTQFRWTKCHRGEKWASSSTNVNASLHYLL